jgi:hypothetical protein
MKIAIALIGIALAAVLVVSATMGAGTLVPGGESTKKAPRGAIATNGKARLMPVSFAPATLKGTSFRPGENVRVELEGIKTKNVQANSAGAFTVRFPSRADRCHGMSASAVGDKGSRASFQLAELMCAMSGATQ